MGARVPAFLLAMAITANPVAAQQNGHPGVGAGAGISRGGGAAVAPRASVSPVHSAPLIRSAPPSVTLSAPGPVVRSLPAQPIQPAPGGFGGVGPSIRVVRPSGVMPLFAPGSARDATPRETRQRAPNVAVRTPLGAKQINRTLVTRNVDGFGPASMLRNNAFASLSTRRPATRALANATFEGRLAGQKRHDQDHGWFWRHRRPIIVIGWFGPLFWPYAFGDLIDYTFWPYAYDAFWPYAFDDLYVGLFGPYSYEGAQYSPGASSGGSGAAVRRAAGPEVCGAQIPALTDWPIEQIAQTVQPDDAQQATLGDLKEATAKAIEVLQSACPAELPSTPTVRLAAMRKRVEAMLSALGVVRPALERFYGSLTDEQKARFNLVTTEAQPARAGEPPSDVAAACAEQAANPIAAPRARIERVLGLGEEQRNALAALDDAGHKAADVLKANCPADEALTPPGRAAAMEQRLNAVLEAVKVVQPALESFYGTLSDEQKARFNQLGAGQS